MKEPDAQANDGNKTVGDIVAEDYRAAEIFERHGIDFCCGGQIPLAEICREKGIDPNAILQEIEAARNEPVRSAQNYSAWDLPFLADYIIKVHHSYLDDNLELISTYTDKIAEVHGARHPELIEIASIFREIATDMAAHLREEEEVLFPAVRRADAARKAGAAVDAKDREIIEGAYVLLKREHEEIGDAVHTIRRLAGDYAIPGDACNTYVVTFRKLKEFEDDLHKHVHLENNILFPRAVER